MNSQLRTVGALVILSLSSFSNGLPFPNQASEMGHEHFWSNKGFMDTLTDYLTSAENVRKAKTVYPTQGASSGYSYNPQQYQPQSQRQIHQESSAFSELAAQLVAPQTKNIRVQNYRSQQWNQYQYPPYTAPSTVYGNPRTRDGYVSESRPPLATYTQIINPSVPSPRPTHQAPLPVTEKEILVFHVAPTTQSPYKKSRRNRQKKQQRRTTTTPAPVYDDAEDDEGFEGEDEQEELAALALQDPREQYRVEDEGQTSQSQHIFASPYPQQVSGPQNQQIPTTFLPQQEQQQNAPQLTQQSQIASQFNTEEPKPTSTLLIATVPPSVAVSTSSPLSEHELENGLEKKTPNLMQTLGGILETGRKILYFPRGVVDVVDQAMSYAEQNPYVGFVLDKVSDKIFGSTKGLGQQPVPVQPTQPQNVQ